MIHSDDETTRAAQQLDESFAIEEARTQLWFAYRDHARHPENDVSAAGLRVVGRELGLSC